ncbi:tRNA pseudouridine(55) synthase TruB [Turicibacter sp. TJ11]|uniref:tRNA pseudouridine(55) synthase TruB n=1 Tax=Turicibacter sp. TJ11 TaxID=2806443 RepID=UPI001F1A6E88|nr:tRNA pseudouridine(55) synthase TruB [Turicibacter sp. TJ11]
MDGVLLLDKPAGMTSHDCVNIVRKVLKTKKVGHTGTLDPSVTGVLPICVGRATKISQFLTANEKEYLGEVTIGFSTTTEDADGDVVEKKVVDRVMTKEEVLDVLKSMLGTSIQVPPMYSAVKVNGKKLYEYARAGIEVERPQREVTIYELELLGDLHQTEDGCVKFSFRVKGSKGLFVRTVAVTIGEKLGYPAHMSHLRRIASGVFKISDCLTIDAFKEKVEQETLTLLTLEEAMADFPSVIVDSWVEKLVRNGVQLYPKQVNHTKHSPVALFNQNGQCLAVYEKHPTNDIYRSMRGFF